MTFSGGSSTSPGDGSKHDSPERDASERESSGWDRLRRLAAALYVLAVLTATLVPVGGIGWEPSDLSFCIICGERGTADAFLNVLLFVPVGALLVRDLGLARTFVLGGLLSLAIETAQLWIPGRYTAVSDLLFNATGAGVGALVGRLPVVALLTGGAVSSEFEDARERGWRSGAGGRVRRFVRVFAVGWAAGTTLFLLATGVLLRTTVTDAPLYGQWTPDLGGGVYEGRILEARVGGMQVGSRRVEDQDRLRSLLKADAALEVRFIAGSPPRTRAPVFNVFDGDRQPILSLSADGNDLVYYRRYRADDLRLDRPDFRMPGGLQGVSEGDTVSVRVTASEGSGFRAAVAAEGGAEGGPLLREGTWAHTPGRSWSLFLYSGEGPPTLRFLADLAWLALLGLPLGVWGPSLRALSVLTGALLAGFGLAAGLSSLVTAPLWQFSVLLAGVLLGRAFRFALATWWDASEPGPR